jgi:hypothetical protein
VRTAVYLDDQTRGEAGKVHNEMIDEDLLAKFEADLLQLAQFTPEATLSARSALADVPRALICHAVQIQQACSWHPHP